MSVHDLTWWNGHTIVCEGCGDRFPMLDDVFKVATVTGDPCAWHRGFLEPLQEDDLQHVTGGGDD